MTKLHRDMCIIYLISVGKSRSSISKKFHVSVGYISNVMKNSNEIRELINEELVDKYMKNIMNRNFEI